jgi:membrane associated rhomboid family serine protease
VEAALWGAERAGLAPNWRIAAYQYAGFWQGLLFGWDPNYAAQPYLMFLSHGFVHTGPGHLLGNLLALGWLGAQLQTLYTARRLALLLALSAGGAAGGFVVLSTSPNPVVGASGAIMGLFALWLLKD